MKKKSVLAIEPVKPKTQEKDVLTVQEATIRDEKHLIIDLFKNGEAAYRIALAADDYAHYSYGTGTWDAKTGWNNPYNTAISRAHISPAYERLLKRWTKKQKRYTHEDIADEIFRYEYDISGRRSMAKQKKEQEEMEKLLAEIPDDIPQAFRSRIMNHIDVCNVIAYKRHGSCADYRCLQCGGQSSRNLRVRDPLTGISELQNVPRDGEAYICPVCKKAGRLRPIGYMNQCTAYGQEFDSVLYQTSGEKLVIRIFRTIVTRRVTDSISIDTYERGRIILTRKGDRQYIQTYSGSWIKAKSVAICGLAVEYGREKAVADSAFRYCPENMYRLLNCDSSKNKNMAVIQALVTYANCPQTEALYKVGLKGICRRLMYVQGRTRKIDRSATEAAKILKLSKEDFRYLVEKAEKGHDECMTLKMIRYAVSRDISRRHYDRLQAIYETARGDEKECDMLLGYQSIDKLYNAVSRYKEEYRGKFREALREYADYLHERQAAGDDMTNEIYLRPRRLHETYTRLRIENEHKKDEMYVERMKSIYPKIPEACMKISKRYTWQQGGLMIRPAADAGEIVMEGRILHHCVGSEYQSYMKNYNNNKGYILFVRRVEAPDVPYVTVEIAGDRIRQWYGIHDTQPDREEIEGFLEGFVKHLNPKKVKASA